MKIFVIEIDPSKAPASKACWNPPKYMTPDKHKAWLEGSWDIPEEEPTIGHCDKCGERCDYC